MMKYFEICLFIVVLSSGIINQAYCRHLFDYSSSLENLDPSRSNTVTVTMPMRLLNNRKVILQTKKFNFPNQQSSGEFTINVDDSQYHDGGNSNEYNSNFLSDNKFDLPRQSKTFFKSNLQSSAEDGIGSYFIPKQSLPLSTYEGLRNEMYPPINYHTFNSDPASSDNFAPSLSRFARPPAHQYEQPMSSLSTGFESREVFKSDFRKPGLTPFYSNTGQIINAVESDNSFSEERFSNTSPINYFQKPSMRQQLFYPSVFPNQNHPLHDWIMGKSMSKFLPDESKSDTFLNPKQNFFRYSQSSSEDQFKHNQPSYNDNSFQITNTPSEQYSMMQTKALPIYHRGPTASTIEIGSKRNYQKSMSIGEQSYGSLLSLQQNDDGISGFIITVPNRCPENARPDSSGECRPIFLPNTGQQSFPARIPSNSLNDFRKKIKLGTQTDTENSKTTNSDESEQLESTTIVPDGKALGEVEMTADDDTTAGTEQNLQENEETAPVEEIKSTDDENVQMPTETKEAIPKMEDLMDQIHEMMSMFISENPVQDDIIMENPLK